MAFSGDHVDSTKNIQNDWRGSKGSKHSEVKANVYFFRPSRLCTAPFREHTFSCLNTVASLNGWSEPNIYRAFTGWERCNHPPYVAKPETSTASAWSDPIPPLQAVRREAPIASSSFVRLRTTCFVVEASARGPASWKCWKVIAEVKTFSARRWCKNCNLSSDLSFSWNL